MIAGIRTTTDARLAVAYRVLTSERLRAPATGANRARNARAELDRHRRWATARDALWRLLDRELAGGVTVAIVGAGNGDTLPLARIAARAARVTLIDLDPDAIRSARRRQPIRLRRRITLCEHDITSGWADALATAAAAGEDPEPSGLPETPLPGAPYDLVIGDLFYSQLLYPALVDLDIPEPQRSALTARYSPMLTRSTVARLQASARTGHVLHIHDPIAWWPGHPQPVTLSDVLSVANDDPMAALALAARGTGPRHSDPRVALDAFAIPIRTTAVWRWPFASEVDYIACATLTGPFRSPTDLGPVSEEAGRGSAAGVLVTAPRFNSFVCSEGCDHESGAWIGPPPTEERVGQQAGEERD